MPQLASDRLRTCAGLAAATAAALLVHGYHPSIEDGELYLPGVKKALDSSLYPFNDAFFMSHARLTMFAELIASSVRVSHLPFDLVVLLWHVLCVFAFLLGCWRVGKICFGDARAAWGGTVLVASLLTIPVAGTALYIMDQYLNTRDFSTAGIMLVLADTLERKYWRAALWIVAIAAIHPLMSVFGLALIALTIAGQSRAVSSVEVARVAAALLPALPFLRPVSPVYRQILNSSHAYFLVLHWEWYEWVGIFAPLALLWWMGVYAREQGLAAMASLARALVTLGVLCFLLSLLVCLPALGGLALAQPLRILHLVFIVLFILGGGLLAQHVLKSHAWRWGLLIIPICLGMFFAQRELFPASDHLELPGVTPRNAWAQAFDWIRSHTPRDAIFAMDPDYMNLAGNDEHGFREMAERSALASRHDRGAVSMFPALADMWQEQDLAQKNWRQFTTADFHRLRQRYGVNWVVLQQPGVSNMNCPYQNSAVLVCRIDQTLQ